MLDGKNQVGGVWGMEEDEIIRVGGK